MLKVLVALVVGTVVGVGVFAPARVAPSSEVNGTVLLDGVPLGRAEVVLVPEVGEDRRCLTARAVTDPNGRFLFPADAGAAAVVTDRYRVLVLDHAAVVSKGHPGRIPWEYQAQLDTPLRLDVGGPVAVLDIPIASAPRSGRANGPNWSPEQRPRFR